MTIQMGYGDKPTHIKVDAEAPLDDPDIKRTARLWIDQEGIERTLVGTKLVPIDPDKEYGDFEVVQDEKGNRFTQEQNITKIQGLETMAYITLNELLDLRNELNAAIKTLVSL